LFGLGKRFRGKVGGATFSKTDATIEFRYRAPHCRFNPSQPGTSPRHMLSGAIAYQTLQRESPRTIPMVRSVLKNNSWYENRWKEQLDKLPFARSGNPATVLLLLVTLLLLRPLIKVQTAPKRWRKR